MSPNNEKPSFLDRGTLLAFILILGFWFAWSKYIEQAYPTKPNAPISATTDPSRPDVPKAPSEASVAAGAAASVGQQPAALAVTAQGTVAESFTDFSDENWAFQVSSKGMGIKNIDIKSYRTRTNEPVVLSRLTSDYPFSTSLLGSTQALDFRIEHPTADTFVGRASLGDMQVEKTMKVNAATFSIDTTVTVSHAGAAFTGLQTTVADAIQPAGEKGMFSGRSSYDHQDWFIRHDGSKQREVINQAKDVEINAGNVSIAGLTEHYFAIAVVDRSDLLPRFESRIPAGADKAVGRLIYQPTVHAESFTQKYVAFAGPKSFSLLSSIDENLTQVIDYGMFTIFAKPILMLLKFLYSLIGNWGIAIVALTIIVRLIVMPFNIFSYKSMKVMQRIQPEMNRIRERYKDKPADQKLQMNQEIMELMKRNKANPLGGCLPMLIQLPVFIALYAVLGQSIELYRAPFGLWIHDLSVRDPFFVLPVLMGVTMFINQKITPSQMDPQQAKIMMFMPVVFSLFMLSLPSGLTLYIFVSTLFGILQQMYFMRDRGVVQSIKEAKA